MVQCPVRRPVTGLPLFRKEKSAPLRQPMLPEGGALWSIVWKRLSRLPAKGILPSPGADPGSRHGPEAKGTFSLVRFF